MRILFSPFPSRPSPPLLFFSLSLKLIRPHRDGLALELAIFARINHAERVATRIVLPPRGIAASCSVPKLRLAGNLKLRS